MALVVVGIRDQNRRQKVRFRDDKLHHHQHPPHMYERSKLDYDTCPGNENANEWYSSLKLASCEVYVDKSKNKNQR